MSACVLAALEILAAAAVSLHTIRNPELFNASRPCCDEDIETELLLTFRIREKTDVHEAFMKGMRS